MEEERESTRYWCHECSRIVYPITQAEPLECSLCHGGFLEETDSDHRPQLRPEDAPSDDRAALSLWAPILLGLIGNPQTRRRHQDSGDHPPESPESDPELDSLIRRRRSSAAILHLLQGIRAGISPESGNPTEASGDIDNGNEREHVILINPFNQTIIIHNGTENPTQNQPAGSFGDYFLGPGLEQLLQHLAENDPNRYGTPPAQKEAIEAMPVVKIEEGSVQCAVCLEDFEVGSEAKLMPCKHRFHGECILPWLELHSSCPVCRYQLPVDSGSGEGEGESGNGEGRRFSVTFPWPFSRLFSSSSSSLNSGWGLSSPRAQEGDRNSRSEDND